MRRLIADINALIEQVRLPVIDLAERFLEVRGGVFDTAPLDQGALDAVAERLEPECVQVLSRPAPRLIEGIGLVWVGAADATGMLWWRAQETAPARKHHVFNPESDSFYDYRNSVWYQGALGARGLTIVGPYIDAWGTDDHALTASIRIERPLDIDGVADAQLVGVAAADLNIATLAMQLDRIWGDTPGAALLGADDRVIASNLALLTPGLRLEPFLASRGWRVRSRHATSVDGWSLASLGE